MSSDSNVVAEAKDSNSKISISALILANMIPVFGALFFSWQIQLIVIIYWAENVVIGIYNVFKMAAVKDGLNLGEMGQAKFFLIPFFTFHFGLFCTIHGVFVFVLCSWNGELPKLNSMVIPIIGLFVSHGISFFQNFIGKGEYKSRSIIEQMVRPYGRIVILHIAIIVAAFPMILLGSPMPLILLFIAMKTFVDVLLHRWSHSSKSSTGIFSIIQSRINQ